MDVMPSHIRDAHSEDYPIRFEWNDQQPGSNFGQEVPSLGKQFAKISKRGVIVIALAAGFAEWIAYRFRKLSGEPVLFHTTEAAWASIVDWHYTDPLRRAERTLIWSEWNGPIRGPLCAASKTLSKAVEFARRRKPFFYYVGCVSNIAELVLPAKPALFTDWRKSAIARMAELFPLNQEDRLGSFVPREVLDPQFHFKPEMTKDLISAFLRALDYTKNPFLRSPEEMKQVGFEGIPYKL
jgi:hypothetical protein